MIVPVTENARKMAASPVEKTVMAVTNPLKVSFSSVAHKAHMKKRIGMKLSAKKMATNV